VRLALPVHAELGVVRPRPLDAGPARALPQRLHARWGAEVIVVRPLAAVRVCPTRASRSRDQ